jgi:hypothetical protein
LKFGFGFSSGYANTSPIALSEDISTVYAKMDKLREKKYLIQIPHIDSQTDEGSNIV